jgi:hypothetical protein
MEPHSYAIPHLTLRLEVALEGGRKKYLVNGKPYAVEAAAKQYLRSEGWWVLAGAEASLFLAVLSANFGNSFFAGVCSNYVGPEAPRLIEALESKCQASLQSGALAAEHASAAADFLCRYYSSVGDQRKFRRLAELMLSPTSTAQMGLLRVYRTIGYFTKGIPDLFAITTTHCIFFEVKSENDALRPEQYIFAETVLREMPSAFQLIRILGAAEASARQLLKPADRPRPETDLCRLTLRSTGRAGSYLLYG